MGERIHLLFPRDFDAFVDGEFDDAAADGRVAAIAAALQDDERSLARADACRRTNEALLATRQRLYADPGLRQTVRRLLGQRTTDVA